MEHLVPIVAGGASEPDNLALACFSCNRRKWDRRAGVDPEAGGQHRLFDPRADRWNEHFSWSADALEIIGTTPVGRATVVLLDLNRDRLKQIRAADRDLGRHPPPGDLRRD